jgi:hypothetical protein
MKKIDFKKELKPLYSPSSKKVEIVDVPEMNFFMIDGQGDPNTSKDFQDAVEALFSLSYTLKFMIKKGELAIDYGVMPLEGLWWTDDMSKFSIEHKEDWKWSVMMMQPEFVTRELVDEATEQFKKKKDLPALSKIRFETFFEGKAAQIMHIGPFSEEGPTVEKLHAFIKDNGYALHGKHHEIYLSDIRRAAPERWKTIIRQPIK